MGVNAISSHSNFLGIFNIQGNYKTGKQAPVYHQLRIYPGKIRDFFDLKTDVLHILVSVLLPRKGTALPGTGFFVFFLKE